MTDATTSREWDDWQAAWRAPGAAAASARDRSADAGEAARTGELTRRLTRHRRRAWAFSILDAVATLAACCGGIWRAQVTPRIDVIVWAAGLCSFAIALLAFAIWNRRDALFYSAQPTTDYLAALRLRLRRRELVPRVLAWFAAAELAFGLFCLAWWSRGSVGRICALYALVMAPLVWWWRWYHRRLRRERAQLDALAPPDDRDPA
jgi:hypothetical protein